MKAGFLGAKQERPLAAISADALETRFASVQQKAAALREVCDPEEEPYRSRYEERDLLKTFRKQVTANAAAEPEGTEAARRCETVGGIVDMLIGHNFMETEESGHSQPYLEGAVEALAKEAAEGVMHIQALNQLGVLWAVRGETELALELLRRAESKHAHLASDDVAKLTGASQKEEEITCLKSILKALASSEGAELSELRKGARGKLSAAAFDAFVADLVNGRWLEVGDEGEVAYGPRAILELADVLRGHGAEVPQMVNY